MGGLANSRHAQAGPYKSVSASASSSNLNRETPLSQPPWRPQSTPVEIINPALTAPGRKGRGGTDDGLGSPTLELVRFTRIVRRLKWKLPFLGEGYARAVNRIGQDRSQADEAELMFKLDFFEFYALVERALVHLMGVFGIRISADMQPRKSNTTSPEALAGLRYHAYHENVLSALDDIGNPLHRVLGVGEVRRQLSRAKELRNLWKTAAEGQNENDKRLASSRWAGAGTRKVAAPLESYRLDEILDTIFAGFDAAFALAQRFVETGQIWTLDDAGDVNMVDWSIAAAVAAGEDPDDAETQWNFMTEAMDWEAI
ncbi:hypothetical protein V8F20_011343 [Naviculisporaceae sp. PSN 640]